MVYLAKSVGQAAGFSEIATDRQRDHAWRLHAELQVTPCSPRCPVWLRYGIQPKGARHSMTPGRCKGNAHKLEHLGIAGRRVLGSRKWSNKTLDDHRAERATFVRQLLEQAGIQPAHGVDAGPYVGERLALADSDVPPRPVLLLHAVAQRQRWKAPNMPPRSWASVNHAATVRQLMIKLLERGESTVEKYLSVPETAEYLNTSERFVRRLIAERRIAFHHVGRHVRLALSDLDLWLASSRVEAIDPDDIRRHLGRVA